MTSNHPPNTSPCIPKDGNSDRSLDEVSPFGHEPRRFFKRRRNSGLPAQHLHVLDPTEGFLHSAEPCRIRRATRLPIAFESVPRRYEQDRIAPPRTTAEMTASSGSTATSSPTRRTTTSPAPSPASAGKSTPCTTLLTSLSTTAARSALCLLRKPFVGLSQVELHENAGQIA